MNIKWIENCEIDILKSSNNIQTMIKNNGDIELAELIQTVTERTILKFNDGTVTMPIHNNCLTKE